MKLVILLTFVVCGLNIQAVEGFPSGTEYSSKLVPGVNTAEPPRVLPDPEISQDIPNISLLEAEATLDDLGYGSSDSVDGFQLATRSGDSGSERIRAFQRDYGLPETGKLDEETRLAIGSPRCGVKRSDKTAGEEVRKWTTTNLTYTIRNYPEGRPEATIRALIKQAFGEWSKVTNLDFVEIDDDSADMEIAFGGMEHNLRTISCSFSSSKTMAHAFFPRLGDLHFNTKYFFEDDSSLGDFLDTALHEIGHSLGLDHINSEASLMHPSASNQFTKPQPIDVKHIQALYGVRKNIKNSTTSKFCSLSKIDAIFEDVFGDTFAFAGDYFYDVSEANPKPRRISSKWPGLPGSIDAAFQFSNGRSYFFKGDKYYRFKGSRLERSYSRTIAKGFPGLPDNVGAAMVDDDGDIFVYKGDQFWVYLAEKKKTLGPGSFRNVPQDVDAVMMSSEGRLVSLKGSYYYEKVKGSWEKKSICSLDEEGNEVNALRRLF